MVRSSASSRLATLSSITWLKCGRRLQQYASTSRTNVGHRAVCLATPPLRLRVDAEHHVIVTLAVTNVGNVLATMTRRLQLLSRPFRDCCCPYSCPINSSRHLSTFRVWLTDNIRACITANRSRFVLWGVASLAPVKAANPC